MGKLGNWFLEGLIEQYLLRGTGKKILSTDDRVNLHLEIQKAQAGFVVPCQVDAVTSAICQLLQDEQLRRTMGENGKRLVDEKYRWDVVAEEVIELYESIIRGYSR